MLLHAFAAGEVAAAAVPFVVGVVLVVVGVRRRRPPAVDTSTWSYGPTADAAVVDAAAPSWTPTVAAPDAEPSAPVPTPPPPGVPAVQPAQRRRGTGLIVVGVILVALTLLGAGVRLVDAAGSRRSIDLPSSVLGLARDQAASDQFGRRALESVPGGTGDRQAAVYGTLPDALLVVVGTRHNREPATEVDIFAEGIKKSGGTLGEGKDVNPGRLGGAARCWPATFAALHPFVCVYVDSGSLVGTLDFLGGSLDAAAKRGLRVREATVRTS